jgi:hypothetical protein
VIARVLEEAGLATTSISLVREHTERVKPPRALFVPFPFGHPLGKANDAALQHDVIRAALALFQEPQGPVLVDYPEDAFAGEDLNLPQAAAIQPTTTSTDVASEVAALQPHHTAWLRDHDGRTAIGVSGVTPEGIPALATFLGAYAAGSDADWPARARDVSLPQWVRWAADDLKAYYFEARLAAAPQDDYQARHRWFWGETAAGNVCRTLRDRLKAAGDPKLDAIAFGIAR